MHDWEDFGTFVNEKTASNSGQDELRVAHSLGIAKPVKKQLVSAYQQNGIEILGMNQCQKIDFDNTISLEFLRGNGPTWEIFRYNDLESEMPENMVNPLVKRDQTLEITKQVIIILICMFCVSH